MTDENAYAQEVSRLQHENADLKARLDKIEKSAQQSKEVKKQALKIGWSVFFPLFDRYRVVRSFMQLSNTVSNFTQDRSQWPDRETLVEETKAFAMSMLRFNIRRRTMMLMFSLVAFIVPGLQLVLVFNQNEMIERQNALFEIEVYDVVAKGLTSGTTHSKLITSALLARVDPKIIDQMATEVFEARFGSYDGASSDGKWESAAIRGHFVRALLRNVNHRVQENEDPEEIFEQAHTTLDTIIRDANTLVPELLRASEIPENSKVAKEEIEDYLYNLPRLMGLYFRLAHHADAEDEFYKSVGPFFAAISRNRSALMGSSGEILGAALPELFADIAQKPEVSEKPEPPTDKDLSNGFKELKKGVGKSVRVRWSNIEEFAEVPK